MSKRIANLLFIIATIGWGSSYLFTKFAVDELQPFTLITYRFFIAFLIPVFIFRKKIFPITLNTLKASAVLGLLLCLMFALFNYVLQTVPPATAGFLLATTVIFVPLLAIIFTKKLPQRQIFIGLCVTFIGLCIFMFNDGFTLNFGTILGIITAILFAFHIVINNHFAKSHDPLQLGIFQLGFTGIFGAVGMCCFEQIALPTTSLGWTSLFILALICTAFGFIVQSVAQKYTSAEETGFILALEPLFSAGFAYIVLGEALSGREWIGAAIILIGVFLASYQPKPIKLTSTRPAH